MRIKVLLTIICLANLVGGVLLCLAIGQSSLTLSFGLSVAALAICGGTGFFAMFRLRSALSKLSKCLEPASNAVATGIQEFDLFGEKVSAALTMVGSESNQARKELDEIKELLSKVDRREFAMDRNGNPISSAKQLRGILSGYGGELEPVVQQVTPAVERSSGLPNRL